MEISTLMVKEYELVSDDIFSTKYLEILVEMLPENMEIYGIW